MTVHGVIDLETLGTDPNSQILTLGALKFDPYTTSNFFDELYIKPDIVEQENMGRSVSQDTIDHFWAKQSAEIIEDAFSESDRISVIDFGTQIRKWCVGVEIIWMQGTFDSVLLEDLFRQSKIGCPWSFWQIDNSRTLMKLMDTDPRKKYSFNAHNALEDCKVQAKGIRDTFNFLNIKMRKY